MLTILYVCVSSKPKHMKTSILFIAAILCSATTISQEKRDLKLNDKEKTIEVIYYHDNGAVNQKGTYTLDGKLQGEWSEYDRAGNKTVAATFDNGKKVGKWLYFNAETVKEVHYNQNAIVSVSAPKKAQSLIKQ